MFIFQTKQNQFIFQTYQTKFNYTKPNSSTLNQTHPPYQSELNHTKPNSSIPNQIMPNQTKADNSQPNLTNPNWLSTHSRTISSFCLLLALVFALVILQNCDLVSYWVKKMQVYRHNVCSEQWQFGSLPLCFILTSKGHISNLCVLHLNSHLLCYQ